jgi:hypothetical protein
VENEQAARIYRMVRRQSLFFFNGDVDKEIDLNHVAVWSLIDHYQPPLSDPWGTFNKVMNTYYYFLNERQKE